MQIEQLLLVCCGFEDAGEQIRVYLDSPTPKPSANRQHGKVTILFHLFAGEQADEIRAWLDHHPTWERLRVTNQQRP